MKVDRKKMIWPKVLRKVFGPNVLSPIDFHMLTLTNLHDRMQKCCPKTATALAVFNAARTEYYSSRTVGGEKTYIFLYTVGTTSQKSIEDSECRPSFMSTIDLHTDACRG